MYEICLMLTTKTPEWRHHSVLPILQRGNRVSSKTKDRQKHVFGNQMRWKGWGKLSLCSLLNGGNSLTPNSGIETCSLGILCSQTFYITQIPVCGLSFFSVVLAKKVITCVLVACSFHFVYFLGTYFSRHSSIKCYRDLHWYVSLCLVSKHLHYSSVSIKGCGR